ncbi:lipoprotein [Micromonospora sonneratiae]|uniref:Lipoprotein n=1 Tax=Micromonospora sonneratiae TaxID=1184706 RepID=A0ABW3Y777_9ACTN
MTQRRPGTALLAVLTVGVLGGCSTEPEKSAQGGSTAPSPTTTPVAAGPPWYDDVQAGAAATKVGAADSPCKLAITFSVPAKWKVKPVEVSEEFASLAQQGGATARCEIDAKPAGNIGFIRVWTVDQGGVGAQAALEKFVAGSSEVTDVQYRRTKAGGLDSFEATYLQKSKLTGEERRGRAICVATGRSGTLLISLGGMDTEEFEEMLPAYVLAKQSISLTQ